MVGNSDQRWLSLAIEQLLNNAVKYTKEGGILIQIKPGEIRIQDTGIGILKEDVPRLLNMDLQVIMVVFSKNQQVLDSI